MDNKLFKKERLIGTVSRGVRCPIIREGDDIVQIVTDSVLDAAKSEGIKFRDRDVVAVTESVVARAQGNYASTDQIAADIKAKFPGGEIGVIFPILSRNRFAICLRGIAKGAKKVYIMLSYPSDEVGNHLITEDEMDAQNVNPTATCSPKRATAACSDTASTNLPASITSNIIRTSSAAKALTWR